MQKSLKDLVKENGLTNLRLWGKILGTKKDYYIAETQAEAGGGEPPGEGGSPDSGQTEALCPQVSVHAQPTSGRDEENHQKSGGSFQQVY